MKKSISIKANSILQFVKFSLVGVLNTGIHYVVFLLLYKCFEIYFLLASAIGYCMGLINSFFMNRVWTFRSKTMRKKTQFMKFVIVNLLAMLINLGTLGILKVIFNVAPEFGQAISIGSAMIVNFLGNKYWTFGLASACGVKPRSSA